MSTGPVGVRTEVVFPCTASCKHLGILKISARRNNDLNQKMKCIQFNKTKQYKTKQSPSCSSPTTPTTPTCPSRRFRSWTIRHSPFLLRRGSSIIPKEAGGEMLRIHDKPFRRRDFYNRRIRGRRDFELCRSPSLSTRGQVF